MKSLEQRRIHTMTAGHEPPTSGIMANITGASRMRDTVIALAHVAIADGEFTTPPRR
jgi:hypothetical protein